MVDPRATGNNNAYSAQFYGGDLKGIEQKFDYIQRSRIQHDLYLNPVFKARSNHRYDTDDYLAIAPRTRRRRGICFVGHGGKFARNESDSRRRLESYVAGQRIFRLLSVVRPFSVLAKAQLRFIEVGLIFSTTMRRVHFYRL